MSVGIITASGYSDMMFFTVSSRSDRIIPSELNLAQKMRQTTLCFTDTWTALQYSVTISHGLAASVV